MFGSLRQKATSGLIWSALERFGKQGVVFVVQIVLARVLAPEQFGLVAMVVVFLALSSIIADAGFSRALVQRKEVGDKEVSTVFYFNLGISCVMTLVLYVVAPYIADFFDFNELTLILRILSIRLVIDAFGSVHASMLSRQLRFKEIFWVTLPSTLLSGIIAIALALNGFGVWALVGQNLIQAILLSLAFWARSDWRPKYIFDVQCLKEMLPYGSRLALSAFIDRTFENIYVLVIGKVYTAVDLGYFQRARSLQRLPVDSIQEVLGRVMFPLFTKIQDDPVRMKSGMRKALQLSALLVFPGMALLSSISEPMIVTLLGLKWLPSVPYLKWLCLVGALYPVHAVNVNILLAIGRSDLILKMSIFKKVLVVINVAITAPFGIQTMVYGIIVSSVIALGINSYYTKQFINYTLLEQCKDVFPMICISVIIFIVNGGLLMIVPFSDHVTLLTTFCASGLVFLIGMPFIGSTLKHELAILVSKLPAARLLLTVLR